MTAEANATAAPSKAPSQKWLTERIEALGRKFNREFTPFEVHAYLESWAVLCARYGSERLDVGLKRCMVECAFFPTEAEIKGRIPEQAYAPRRCSVCDAMEGWVDAGPGRVRRCKHEAEVTA